MNTSKIIIKKFTGMSGASVILAWHGGRLFSVTAAYLDAVYNINDPFQSANVWTEWIG